MNYRWTAGSIEGSLPTHGDASACACVCVYVNMCVSRSGEFPVVHLYVFIGTQVTSQSFVSYWPLQRGRSRPVAFIILLLVLMNCSDLSVVLVSMGTPVTIRYMLCVKCYWLSTSWVDLKCEFFSLPTGINWSDTAAIVQMLHSGIKPLVECGHTCGNSILSFNFCDALPTGASYQLRYKIFSFFCFFILIVSAMLALLLAQCGGLLPHHRITWTEHLDPPHCHQYLIQLSGSVSD